MLRFLLHKTTYVLHDQPPLPLQLQTNHKQLCLRSVECAKVQQDYMLKELQDWLSQHLPTAAGKVHVGLDPENADQRRWNLKLDKGELNWKGFPGDSVVKNPPDNAEDKRRGFTLLVGKIPWRSKWQSTLYSCLEDPMDGGVWQVIVHGTTKSWTWLSDWARV